MRSMVVFSRIVLISSVNRDSQILFELLAPHAPILIPVMTISFPHPATNSSTSEMISSVLRDRCLPRACTVRQKVQKLSHPICTTMYFRVKMCANEALIFWIFCHPELVEGDDGAGVFVPSGSSGSNLILSLYCSSSGYCV